MDDDAGPQLRQRGRRCGASGSREFPDGADVVAITINNQLGQSYFRGFERAVDGSNIRIVGNELHDVNAPSIQNQLTSAAATRADVVVINDAGTFCTQALAGIERSAWKPVVITAQPCAQIPTTYGPLREQGLTGNGTNVIRYYYAPTDSDADDKQFADLYVRTLREQGWTRRTRSSPTAGSGAGTSSRSSRTRP